MATQHPDNAGPAFWTNNPLISTAEETEEIYHNSFDLDCDETMWDWEGKFADEAMLEKLLSLYHDAFSKKQLGRDFFITLRVPNIWEEKSFKLARAYMSVLSAAEFMDSLKLHTPPVFEFILPMTKRADQLIHIQNTFQKTAKVHEEIFGDHRFGTGYIHIIPLFEGVEDLANCAEVLKEFLKEHEKQFGFKPPYLRPFIARSDPALNSGFVAAVLGVRMALREFYRIQEESGVPMYPIIGTGSLPFRGGINPENIEWSLEQYQGVKTVTIQSAFRYDYPQEEVHKALAYIKKALANPKPVQFSDQDFEKLRELTQLFHGLYAPTVEKFAPLINQISKHVPKRRERVQHVGLFGYSRGVGAVRLPRAISFTAACYSLGIPPEFIGTGRALKQVQANGDLEFLEKHFFTMKRELIHAGKFLNRENLAELAKTEEFAREIEEDIALIEEILDIELGPQKDNHYLHRNLSSNILIKLRMGLEVTPDLVEAAVLRKSLG